jgi:hypothetical protein
VPVLQKEGLVSSTPSQGQGWQGMRCGLDRDGFHRKRGADVGSGVDNGVPGLRRTDPPRSVAPRV